MRWSPSVEETASIEASDESRAAAEVARRAVTVLYATIEEHKDYLGQIDAVAGDGDHGIGMSRGSKAAAEAAAETEGGVQTVLVAAGAAFGDKAGGTSGILWGLLLDGVGKALGNTEKVTAERVADAVEKSATDLQTFSKASLGDKTMLDALFPFVETLRVRSEAGPALATPGGRRPRPASRRRRPRHRSPPRSAGLDRWPNAASALPIPERYRWV